MAGQVRSRLGLNMQLHSLFEAPTIAAIASRIVQDDVKHDTAFDVLLPLKPQGCRPPLFCIHSVFGFGWSYVALSQHLHPDQPLYALQSRGIGGNGELAETFDGMVQDYINQIQRVQPKGPYHLLGWSFGGSIAHSMAAKLEKRGEKVSLLALMDSITTYSAESDDVDVDHDADVYTEHFARSNTINTLDEGKALWTKARDVVRNNIVISKQFSPSIYSGDMIFFQATKSSPVIDVSTWEPFTQGAITKHQVECAHLEMDTSKPMELIGRVLAMKLEELHQQSLDVKDI
ncbi:hypothetical protein BGZ80_005346 [Entomortierella chlamydospora]|uniref:Thioesterase domain-containing protein n=1 Tax=Entomortierella chlamydospora TaxID=101097 RepID=A0A9P6MKX0_9FUNG|nr:hypothetical protein BGZ79_003087 [Entomortierella chlamydospora]KAG0006108.1 hypothetical protein BGZ80_005346 [Entomortierella chlamydospora]